MADRAHSWTDWKISEIEKELDRIYSRAQKELGEKADKYFSKFGDAWKKKQAEVDAGKLSQDDFNKWFQGKVATGEHWFNMERQMAEELLHVNETATAYVNDQLPEVYSRNYNQTANGINGQISGYSFELVDASTVRRLATDDKTLLPYKYVDGKKDVRWNTQKVNSEVLQGILQGDSIPHLSKRLENVVGMNRNSAIRNARTSCTSAENKGRMDMINDAEDKGVHVQKGWLATNDDRTRDSHASLNGTYVDSDDLFDNGLEYPGDPNGDPSEVYNCRCTLVYKVVAIGDNLVQYPGEEQAEEQKAEEEPVKAFDERISELQQKVEQDGLQTEYVMEAGKAVQDEISPIIEEKKKEREEIIKQYDEVTKRKQEAWKEYKSNNDPEKNAELFQKYKELDKEWWELYHKKQETFKYSESADFLKDKLSQVREMGTGGENIRKHLNNSRSQVVKNMEFAYDHYPTSWVEKSVDYGNLKVSKVNRGYYSHYKSEIALSGYSDETFSETAIHELGHRFERVIPGIKDQEKEFYERRTAGEDLAWLGDGYARSEVTRKDDFVHPYMGKDYGGSAYELVSMGFQYAYTDPIKLHEDPDMEQWIYGLLALAP